MAAQLRSGALLVDRPLGGRQRLEALVGDRLAALDREPVRSGRKAGLGPLEGRKLLAEIVLQAFGELVLLEVGAEVRRVELVRFLAVVLVLEPAERPFDALALGLEELTCPVGVHRAQLTARSASRNSATVSPRDVRGVPRHVAPSERRVQPLCPS